MSQQTSPWLEGKYGWAFGESNWNGGMDENLLKFSFMFDKNVDGVVSSLPAAVNGAAYFLTTDNRLYFAVGTTWYSTSTPKWFIISVKASGQIYQFDGSSLVALQSNSDLSAALALKAPLASPAFTGTPTTTTPVQGDSSSKVASTQYVQTEFGLRVSVFAPDYGMSVSASAADNMNALKAALAATPSGGTLYIPKMVGTYAVDTIGGLTDAALIDKPMTVVIDGNLKTNYSAIEVNPSYLFKITADDVVFKGSGSIEGDGATLIAGGGVSSSQFPGLIYVESCNNFSFSGIKLIRPPCTSFMLVFATQAHLYDFEHTGGVLNFQFSVLRSDYNTPNPAYIGSAYFGIVASGGGDHVFDNIRFTKGVDGGQVINAIFTSGLYGNSNGNTTSNCYIQEPWEKLLYGYGDNQVITGNHCYGAYGTADTEAIRVWGHNNIVTGNYTELFRGAIQALDGHNNIISDNNFHRLRATGINVQDFSVGYAEGISYNKIDNNILTWDSAAPEKRFAIRILGRDVSDIVGCTITNNTLKGFGTGETDYVCQITAVSPKLAQSCVVKNNIFTDYPSGVNITRGFSCSVSGNIFQEGTGVAIHIVDGSRNSVMDNTGDSVGTWFLSINAAGASATRFLNNRCNAVTNNGVRNMDPAFNLENYGEGNQYTSKGIAGQVVLSALATNTITHGGIAPNATIKLVPINASAANIIAGAGLYTLPNATNFNIVTGSGAAALGTETLRYVVVQ